MSDTTAPPGAPNEATTQEAHSAPEKPKEKLKIDKISMQKMVKALVGAFLATSGQVHIENGNIFFGAITVGLGIMFILSLAAKPKEKK